MDWFLEAAFTCILYNIAILILLMNFIQFKMYFNQNNLKSERKKNPWFNFFTKARVHCDCQEIKSLCRVLGINSFEVDLQNFGTLSAIVSLVFPTVLQSKKCYVKQSRLT